MQHVVVGSSGDLSENQIQAAIINNQLAGNGLFSLIDGLRGKNIDAESIGRTANRIKDYKERISTPAKAKLFIDSGGYSFIKGDLAPHNLDLACNLYHSYQRLEAENYNYIFTLDIPLSLKFTDFNTKRNVFEYNRKSLQQTLKNIADNPILSEKIFFIHQFKTIDHYEIWKNLEEELSIKEAIKFKAIGGMVSIKEVAGISIAPFIATAYQALWDYETSRFNGKEFMLHFLGIYVAYDRFVIAFLERLFQHYLGSGIPVHFTYDTFKFKRNAMHEQDYICEFDGAALHKHNPLQLPESFSHRIYGHGIDTADQAKADLKRKANGQNHHSQAALAPLVIASELAIDRFFEHIIRDCQLVELLVGTKNIMWFKHDLDQALLPVLAGYHKVFGKYMLKSIKESLVHVYWFHRWYTVDRGSITLDSLSREFITTAINFPFKLN